MNHVCRARENMNTNLNMKPFTSVAALFAVLSVETHKRWSPPLHHTFSPCAIRMWNNVNQLPVFQRRCYQGGVVMCTNIESSSRASSFPPLLCGAYWWSCTQWTSFSLLLNELPCFFAPCSLVAPWCSLLGTKGFHMCSSLRNTDGSVMTDNTWTAHMSHCQRCLFQTFN